jgi:chemotaxis protein methyltransferase CheR
LGAWLELKDITDKEFDRIREYIKSTLGISLSNEKKSLIYSRLRTTLADKGFDNFTQYFDYLINDKTDNAVVHFIDKVTTNHTFFMREVDHFDFFRETVLPFVEENWRSQKDLRLWCCACSSGEEPYTLQMIIQDFFKNIKEKWDMQILATDISTQVLDKAVMGVYPTESIKPLPDSWKKDYFKQYDAAHSIIMEDVKKQIIFRRFNMMEGRYPFKKKFQVIFCRNVMIYFDNKSRDETVKKFYDLMEPGGYLFIGHSESLNHTGTEFKYVMPAVYRKT